MNTSRRTFLRNAGAAGLLGSIGGLGGLSVVGRATAQDTGVTPDLVRFTPDMEPLVRLIEETPRDRCIEALAERIKNGATYQQLLAATFLAGIRNVNPQPPGFKFHCVFLAHAANYLAQSAPPEERLLPLFWVLDIFKKSQEEDVRAGDFVLRQPTGYAPDPAIAESEFRDAMEAWDESRADAAVIALARSGDPQRVFDLLWAYGARDYRNIGHKAIFVANAWRTLDAIGWQHAEPTLRSLVLGLLDYGKNEVVNDYGLDDQCYPANKERGANLADRLPGNWNGRTENEAATNAMLAPLREGQTDAACEWAAQSLVTGACEGQAIWDAVHLAADEMMLRQPGIPGIHAVTSVNGLRFAYEHTTDRATKFLMLLQGVGWMAQFRNFIRADRDNAFRIDQIESASIPADADAAAESIFATITNDRDAAARMAYAYAQQHEIDSLFAIGRRYVFLKASEHHHLKWPAALFEDVHLVSPRYQPHMAATSMYYLLGPGFDDSPAVQRAIAALA